MNDYDEDAHGDQWVMDIAAMVLVTVFIAGVLGAGAVLYFWVSPWQ